MIEHLLTLGMLVLLQAVLGFDNLLYISLETKSAPKEKQKMVRFLGIGLAIVLRIGLLFLLVNIIKYFQNPLFKLDLGTAISGEFNMHSLIVLLGGLFIIYTAMKEIWHMMFIREHDAIRKGKKRSITGIVIMIILMNIVFSFDSILSAMALTDEFWVMAIAIAIGGVLMIWFSGHVAKFLEKNKMFEVLGLFILFLVGVMLLSEGGHLAHIRAFGSEIHPMSKATFYFVIVFIVIIDIVQTRYHKNLSKLDKKFSSDKKNN